MKCKRSVKSEESVGFGPAGSAPRQQWMVGLGREGCVVRSYHNHEAQQKDYWRKGRHIEPRRQFANLVSHAIRRIGLAGLLTEFGFRRKSQPIPPPMFIAKVDDKLPADSATRAQLWFHLHHREHHSFMLKTCRG